MARRRRRLEPEHGDRVPSRGEVWAEPSFNNSSTASAPPTPRGSGGGASITPWELWAGRRRAAGSADTRRPAAAPSCPRAGGNPPARGQRGAGTSSLGGFSTARQFPRQGLERPEGAEQCGPRPEGRGSRRRSGWRARPEARGPRTDGVGLGGGSRPGSQTRRPQDDTDLGG